MLGLDVDLAEPGDKIKVVAREQDQQADVRMEMVRRRANTKVIGCIGTTRANACVSAQLCVLWMPAAWTPAQIVFAMLPSSSLSEELIQRPLGPEFTRDADEMPQEKEGDSLLDRLLQVLLGSIELLFQEANLPLQALIRTSVSLALLGSRLGLSKLGLELFELGLKERNLVRKRGDLLIFS